MKSQEEVALKYGKKGAKSSSVSWKTEVQFCCHLKHAQWFTNYILFQDMKRPFKAMRDLDMEQVISDIIDEISNA
ncbi:hypothetical protein ACSQ67_000547 [Phaseolus vulgaris]